MSSAGNAATRNWRHTAVYVGLVAIATGAGALFTIALTDNTQSKAAAKAAVKSAADKAALKAEWEPTATGETARLKQIAAYVGGRYKSADGKQFTQLTLDTPVINGQPAQSVVVEHVATGNEDKSALSDAAVYSICGDNPDCTISGAQTTARGTLVQREALELALRTFRALTNIHIVVVELPVLDSQIGRLDVYFVRDDLARANSQPISATLPLKNPPIAGQPDPKEAAAIKALVVNIAFTSSDAATRKAHEYVVVPVAEAVQVAQAQAGASGAGATAGSGHP